MNSEQAVMDKFWKKLKASPTVMLGAEGLDEHSEPMSAVFDEEYDRTLFFFTRRDNRLVRGLTPHTDGIAQFVSTGHDFFACLRGHLSICDDASIRDEFWSSAIEDWYEGGKADPQLQMLRFTITEVEMWQADLSMENKLRLMLGGNLSQSDIENGHLSTSF